MKKTRRNAVLRLLAFIVVTTLCVLWAIYGVDKEKVGKATNIPLGLDLQGGVSITYQITTDNPGKAEIDATIDKLQRRVDAYSSEGEVYEVQGNRITVEVPVDTSKYDAHEILDQLGQPGQLLFLDENNYQLWAQGLPYEAAVTGSDVKNAEPAEDTNSATKAYVTSLYFTDEGAKKFGDFTSANVGKITYIIYDNKVVSSPRVKQAITGGQATIDGMADYDEASNLASTIKIGALPLELEQLQYNIVGAKLGQEAVSTSLMAGAIGFGIICLLLIILFRLPGFIASLALSCYVLIMALVLSSESVTLTLPGIAGIILSIGMAVDANVIIFTRIKEELATGKGVSTAADAGFHKALSAILDGNITTLIAAFVLRIMGTGTIKGFANTLIIGIILSMITALFITKFLLKICIDLGLTKVGLYGKAKDIKVRRYVKSFKFFGVISLIAIAIGIAFLPINKDKNGSILNFSLEFTGGTSTTVAFTESYTLEQAEADIVPVITEATGVSASDVQIQIVEDSNQIIFKTPELDQATDTKLGEALKDNFDLETTDDGSEDAAIETSTIGSTISGEMRKDAIIAIAIASVLMLIYIAIRFSDIKFGAAAVIALLHDVLFVFMVYSVGQLSVGNTFIACMLTIVGYSINATIIIFDRIRENLKESSREDVDEIVNKSISQTFTRTIYTSLTTFVMVCVLFVMGVASLKEFTFTLMCGIVIGAYSSVCITGPLWRLLGKITGGKKKKA